MTDDSLNSLQNPPSLLCHGLPPLDPTRAPTGGFDARCDWPRRLCATSSSLGATRMSGRRADFPHWLGGLVDGWIDGRIDGSMLGRASLTSQDGEGAYDQKVGVDFFRAEIEAITEFGSKAVAILKAVGHVLAVSQIMLYNAIIVSDGMGTHRLTSPGPRLQHHLHGGHITRGTCDGTRRAHRAHAHCARRTQNTRSTSDLTFHPRTPPSPRHLSTALALTPLASHVLSRQPAPVPRQLGIAFEMTTPNLISIVAGICVFVKAVESHFAPGSHALKIKEAMIILAHLEHDLTALGSNPTTVSLKAYEDLFHRDMKKIKAEMM